MHQSSDTDLLRYPIGVFTPRTSLSAHDVQQLVDDLDALPNDVRASVARLPDEQLDTPYRRGGWTVRQVVHHLPDSHMNGYVRFKLALTEQEPVIKPYNEAAWAELPDGRSNDIESSLLLLAAVHRKWTSLLRSMTREHFARTYSHPESGVSTLERSLQLYVWHGRHHLAHVQGAPFNASRFTSPA